MGGRGHMAYAASRAPWSLRRVTSRQRTGRVPSKRVIPSSPNQSQAKDGPRRMSLSGWRTKYGNVVSSPRSMSHTRSAGNSVSSSRTRTRTETSGSTRRSSSASASKPRTTSSGSRAHGGGDFDSHRPARPGSALDIRSAGQDRDGGDQQVRIPAVAGSEGATHASGSRVAESIRTQSWSDGLARTGRSFVGAGSSGAGAPAAEMWPFRSQAAAGRAGVARRRGPCRHWMHVFQGCGDTDDGRSLDRSAPGCSDRSATQAVSCLIAG